MRLHRVGTQYKLRRSSSSPEDSPHLESGRTRPSMRLTLLIPIDRRSLQLLSAACALIAAALLWAMAAVVSAPGTPPAVVAAGDMTAARPVPPLPPPWPVSLVDKAVRIEEGEFLPGSTFAAVLRRAAVTAQLVDEVVRATRADFDVTRIRAGRPYKIYFDANDDFLMFRYQPDRQTAVLIARGAQGWRASEVVVPYEIRPRYVHAEINGSLEGALATTWAGRRGAIEVAHRLASIFAWDIDFAADLRVRDTVDLVVEQRFLEGEFAGFGDVVAAELRIAGRMYKAVRYQRTGRTSTYYTPTGESLERAFLRSPVDYSRISSGFSYRRRHPVLNVVRPHYGVDYVAPAGTPVHATADGEVVFIDRNRDAGIHVKISHGGSYTSWYLHLSRPADGLRLGQRVEQGQTIGYVGSTGLVTSTHLDYRLERNGQFIDPLQLEAPVAAPLPAVQMAKFSAQRDQWLNLIRQGQQQVAVVLAGSS